MEGGPDDHLPGRGAGDGDRRVARGRADFRRDGAAFVHRAEQPVLEYRSEPADGQSAGRHLPIRAEPLCGLAGAGLGRGVADHRHDPGAQHHRPLCGGMEQLQIMISPTARPLMSDSDTTGRSTADSPPMPTARRPAGAIAPRLQPAPADEARAPTPATKVDLRNINFFYGKFQALHDITLPLYDRRVTAFIGPSGCGKSTLLRILNRIYELYPGQVATGEVYLDGVDILAPGLDVNRLRAKIGMVFQKPTPFPMSIYDNISFGIGLYEKLSKSEMDDRVESALKRAALWDEVKQKLRDSGLSLSGGQQ